MEPVELFTILEKARTEKLYAIAERGVANEWQEVLCEERAYEAISNLIDEIVDAMGPEIKPLHEAVTELVMKEQAIAAITMYQTEHTTLPADVRDDLDSKLKEGVLDVSNVSSFPRENQNP